MLLMPANEKIRWQEADVQAQKRNGAAREILKICDAMRAAERDAA